MDSWLQFALDEHFIILIMFYVFNFVQCSDRLHYLLYLFVVFIFQMAEMYVYLSELALWLVFLLLSNFVQIINNVIIKIVNKMSHV